jgi:drug/metabolite transporter (DMT)-like permease
MNWLFFAIIGHAANGVAFVIDKALLSSAFKRSATYAGLVGVLSFVVIVAAPWVDRWPTGTPLLIALLSGITFVLALWAFFGALARAEASRIVPIIGSLIPILTLVGTSLFLDERLGASRLAGFALLVIATIILSSSGGAARPTKSAVGLALVSGVLFAFASVTGKYVYDTAGFLPGFLTTRLAAAAMAVVILALLDPLAGGEFWSVIRPKSGAGKKKAKSAGLLAVFGQSLGAVGFLFVQLATSQGSAAIVNALQAIQYALLVLAAIFLRKRAPQLLGENLERRTLVIKIGALLLTAAGLALVI